jgi:hypothetical protein
MGTFNASLPVNLLRQPQLESRTVTKAEMKQAILEGLQACGWSPVDDVSMACTSAVAQKTFVTAVGEKTATARFTDNPAECCRLSGEYESEGSNVLSASSDYLWYHRTPREEVRASDLRELATAFAATADLLIGDSYAMRLMR